MQRTVLGLLFLPSEALRDLTSRLRPRNSAVGPDPDVDPTVPISNDELNAAIEAYAQQGDPTTYNGMILALARAVYVAAAPPHLISIRRSDGVRLTPPGLNISAARPRVPDPPLLVFTDERFMKPEEARNLQVLYAWEVFSDALRDNGPGVLVNLGDDYPRVMLAPHDCRRVRRLLGKSGHGPDKKWPAGWPQPEKEPWAVSQDETVGGE